MKNDQPKNFDFEKGMSRLEEIIKLFDDGGLTLEQMETYFIEGMDLIKKCSERLESVEVRITKLMGEQETEWMDQSIDNEQEELT